MAKRFDRTDGGGKIHMQSLGALGHFDYNSAGAYSYEQAFALMRQLGLSTPELEQQYRRMTFNIVARNQDDHVKNIAFLMDKQGRWSLAPAFDVTYSYNPAGIWTAMHQMSMNGKRDAFTLEDFKACARVVALKRGRAETIIEEVRAAVERWPEFASRARVSPTQVKQIREAQRLEIPKR
jgi:serine/threonine-protein kinase HipA